MSVEQTCFNCVYGPSNSNPKCLTCEGTWNSITNGWIFTNWESGNKRSMTKEDIELSKWMSAALSDPSVCYEMQEDVRKWFASFDMGDEPKECKTCGTDKKSWELDTCSMKTELEWIKDLRSSVKQLNMLHGLNVNFKTIVKNIEQGYDEDVIDDLPGVHDAINEQFKLEDLIRDSILRIKLLTLTIEARDDDH